MGDSAPEGGVVDLRSDTVTRPTPAMREAMAQAEVGDDVFGEDPTVNRLEAEAADRMGMDAALYVPSGTMANQAAIYTHISRGDEVILEARSHILSYECGALAALSGGLARPIPGFRGAMDPDEVRAALRPGGSLHEPTTGLICVENTHNNASGAALPREHMAALFAIGSEHSVPVHVDGARIFNAALALQTTPAELVAGASSVMFCFSKGLSAPVGSVLCGSADFIGKARRVRKLFGGGMRQAGIIAAGALYALRHLVERLPQDHANARALAEAIAEMPGLSVDLESVQTNIVIFRIERQDLTAPELVARLRERGILCLPRGPGQIRMVTHREVSREGVGRAIGAMREALSRP